ncbi:hypothetical protein D3C72_1749920 [compost metagenome]
MPTADRAMMSPTKISSARTALLTALRSDSSAPVAERSRRDSMAADIHSAISSTAAAVSAPSIMVRTDSVAPPTFQWIWSSSSSTRGNSPVTHSTMPSQASHEMERSIGRTQAASG